jgi:Fe-S cluster assembly iron-binding protein IscA
MQMIEFTPRAIEAINQYKTTLLIPEGYFLRVGIRQKNAQDKGLLIGFDEKTDKDRSANVNGIEVIYNAGQIFFFAGMIIDYQDLDGRKGFKFLEKSKVAAN